jgi:hypothetical protein
MKGIFILFLALSFNTALSQVTRNSITGIGNWDLTTSWTCACIPSGTDNVLIRGTITVPSTYTTLHTGTVTINSGRTLTNQGTLTGSALTLNGALNNSGTSSHTSVTINSGGSLTINGGVTNVSGNVTVNSGGNFTYLGSGLLTFNGSSSTLSGTLNVFDLEVGGASSVTLGASAVVNVYGFLRLYSGSGGSYDADGPGSGVTIIKSTSAVSGGGIRAPSCCWSPDPSCCWSPDQQHYS